MSSWLEFYEAAGLTPVINVSGTMTSLGASIALPEVAEAMSRILPRFVDMHELQAKASETIARLTGAEAGFVTASASAGISQMVAAAMTGTDAALIERLPSTDGMKNEVIIQMGHVCQYGAPVDQAIRLAGARAVVIGTSTLSLDHHVTGAINERTAAAVYVASHHVVEYGQIPLKRFAELCHAQGVPVIVDAASEYDLKGFLADGADVAIYSAHKFLSGPTGGIVAGKKELIRAGYMQNIGIARGMKVGKESIFGTTAALEAWEKRDHAGIRARERAALDLWLEAASGFEGVTAAIVPDPTHNPLDRLRLSMDPAKAGASVYAFAAEMARGTPAIVVRAHEAELGWIQLDPCNLHDGQARIVAERLSDTLKKAAKGELKEPDIQAMRNRSVTAYLSWPD